MIPHSIIRAALPVTKGAAKEVPVLAPYPPPGTVVRISTPGAAKSGLIYLFTLVYPLPENSTFDRSLQL